MSSNKSTLKWKRYLEKHDTDTDNLKRNNKKFLKDKRSILKSQQGAKNEGYNVFTAEFNDKITLTDNNDK